MSKYYVVARTTDNSEQNRPLETVLTEALASVKEAEYWIDDCRNKHPTLLVPSTLYGKRKFEVVILASEDES